MDPPKTNPTNNASTPASGPSAGSSAFSFGTFGSTTNPGVSFGTQGTQGMTFGSSPVPAFSFGTPTKSKADPAAPLPGTPSTGSAFGDKKFGGFPTAFGSAGQSSANNAPKAFGSTGDSFTFGGVKTNVSAEPGITFGSPTTPTAKDNQSLPATPAEPKSSTLPGIQWGIASKTASEGGSKFGMSQDSRPMPSKPFDWKLPSGISTEGGLKYGMSQDSKDTQPLSSKPFEWKLPSGISTEGGFKFGVPKEPQTTESTSDAPAVKPNFTFGAPITIPTNPPTFSKTSSNEGTSSTPKVPSAPTTFSFGAMPTQMGATQPDSQKDGAELSNGTDRAPATAPRKMAKIGNRFKKSGMDLSSSASPSPQPGTPIITPANLPLPQPAPAPKKHAPFSLGDEPVFKEIKVDGAPTLNKQLIRNRVKVRVLNDQFAKFATSALTSDPFANLTASMRSYLEQLQEIADDFKKLQEACPQEALETTQTTAQKTDSQPAPKMVTVPKSNKLKRSGEDLTKDDVVDEEEPRHGLRKRRSAEGASTKDAGTLNFGIGSKNKRGAQDEAGDGEQRGPSGGGKRRASDEADDNTTAADPNNRTVPANFSFGQSMPGASSLFSNATGFSGQLAPPKLFPSQLSQPNVSAKENAPPSAMSPFGGSGFSFSTPNKNAAGTPPTAAGTPFSFSSSKTIEAPKSTDAEKSHEEATPPANPPFEGFNNASKSFSFGSPTPQTTASPFSFGAPPTTQSGFASSFGAGSSPAFGTPSLQKAKSSITFGAAPSTPSFGTASSMNATSTPLFGAALPKVSEESTTTSVGGNSAFGMSTTLSQSPFSFGTPLPATGAAFPSTISSFGAPPTSTPSATGFANTAKASGSPTKTKPTLSSLSSGAAFKFSSPAGSTPSSNEVPKFNFSPPKPAEPASTGTAEDEEHANDPQLGDALMTGAGEEEEETLSSVRAALYASEKQEDGTTGWVKKGVGLLKANRHKSKKTLRLLLRADGSGRVLLNTNIYNGMKFVVANNNVKFVAALEEGLKSMSIRVKTAEQAQEFIESIEKARIA